MYDRRGALQWRDWWLRPVSRCARNGSGGRGRVFLVILATTIVALSMAVPVHILSNGIQISTYQGKNTCDEKDRIRQDDFVTIHFEGFFEKTDPYGRRALSSEGLVFFGSSRDGPPRKIVIGEGQTMGNWESALKGQCKGTRSILVITPESARKILPESSGPLVFGGKDMSEMTMRVDVEILDVLGRKPEGGSEQQDRFRFSADGGRVQPSTNRDLFREIDSLGNSDGVLDAKEITKLFLKEHLELTDAYLAAIFEHEDMDTDGVISWDEFSGLKGERAEGTGGGL